MGSGLLTFRTAVLAIGKFELRLGTSALKILTLMTSVFGNQATPYAIRQNRRVWGVR